MAVGCLNEVVLLIHTAVVAAGGKPVVRAERLGSGGDGEGLAPVTVAAGRRELIGAKPSDQGLGLQRSSARCSSGGASAGDGA